MVLKDAWVDPKHPLRPWTVSRYVEELGETFSKMHEIAKANFTESQGKMKSNYDQKCKVRSFSVVEKVLVLLPVQGSSLNAKYSSHQRKL